MLQAVSSASLTREQVFARHESLPGDECVAQGRELARDWRVGTCAFLTGHAVAGEAEYKRRQMRERCIMLHACTAATLQALGLIGAQQAEVLVHANLDDGFAAQFTDLACVLGAALLARIPDADEIVAAQLYAGRLIEIADGYRALIDKQAIEPIAQQLLAGAQTFKQRVLQGLEDAGIRSDDPAELLLALRRIGARRLEVLFGPGTPDPKSPGGRRPQVPAGAIARLQAQADAVVNNVNAADRALLRARGITALVASTDVHEHGKWLVERVLEGLGVRALDGGVSVDPEVLATRAAELAPEVIAVSTYNGVALNYYQRLHAALQDRGLRIPVVMGGRLDQIPQNSNTSLPVDVGDDLVRRGAWVCADIDDVVPLLARLSSDEVPNA
ncbi:MAG: cobalamin-dependent protein [Gammaproteobacteria bacterium]|nr:cobalamin-dependent protein [Gammaproteobacteria bacterium]